MVNSFFSLAPLALASLALAVPAPLRDINEPLVELQKRATCYSGVYMIVGRGTDEDPGEGKPGDVADAVAAQIPNSGSVAVDYPASALDPPYPTSVVDGINNAIGLVQDYVNACGSASRIVLIGFSQGGNVMTDMLAGGVDKPTPLTTDYTQYSTLTDHHFPASSPPRKSLD
jgi:acetylxylan esterase